MKKTIIIILNVALFISISMAIDKSKLYEIKIISYIVSSTIGQNKKVCLYNFSNSEVDIYRKFSNLKIVDNCKNADIIIVKDLENAKTFNKPAFAIGYFTFLNCINCIGGFYWKKGRPQIILIKERLNTFHIKPASKLEKFVIPENFVNR